MTSAKINTPIHRQSLFIVVNSFVLFLFIALIMPIVTSGKFEFSFSSIGYTKFLELFKLPLSVLATLIPFNAFYISYIRSEQSRVQIALFNSTNNFTNYYKHIEEFEKHLKRNLKAPDNIDLNYLYKIFFPKSMSGEFSVTPEMIKIIENIMNTHIDIIKTLVNEDKMIKKFDFRKRVVYLLNCLNELLGGVRPLYLDNHVSFVKGSLKELKNVNEETEFIYMNTYYNHVHTYYLLIDEILKFDISRNYRSLCQTLEMEKCFYRQFDGKNFDNSEELREGEINIKGLVINQEFRL